MSNFAAIHRQHLHQVIQKIKPALHFFYEMASISRERSYRRLSQKPCSRVLSSLPDPGDRCASALRQMYGPSVIPNQSRSLDPGFIEVNLVHFDDLASRGRSPSSLSFTNLLMTPSATSSLGAKKRHCIFVTMRRKRGLTPCFLGENCEKICRVHCNYWRILVCSSIG